MLFLHYTFSIWLLIRWGLIIDISMKQRRIIELTYQYESRQYLRTHIHIGGFFFFFFLFGKLLPYIKHMLFNKLILRCANKFWQSYVKKKGKGQNFADPSHKWPRIMIRCACMRQRGDMVHSTHFRWSFCWSKRKRKSSNIWNYSNPKLG